MEHLAACCRTPPSSCALCEPASGLEATLLANGSHYLYVLDAKSSQHLAAVRFSSHVMHVSPLHCATVDSTALCCLGSGSIVATNLSDVTRLQPDASAVRRDSNDDIFASLLSSQTSKAVTPSSSSSSSSSSSAATGDDISTVVASSFGSDWVVQNALVVNKNLLLCKKSVATGNVVFTISQSTSSVLCGAQDIPLFKAPPLFQHTFPTMTSVQRGSPNRLNVRPAMALVRCHGDQGSGVGQSLDAALFTALVGPERRLANVPIIFLADHQGHVFSCDFTRVERESKSSSSGDAPLVPLCSLEQVVVAVHSVSLPVGGGSQSSAANALVMVGQRGKLVLCYQDKDSLLLKFVEFHVPGPILSSVLIPFHSLFYSTLKGVYKICLRRGCMEVLEPEQGNAHVLIPYSSLNFPERLTHSATYIIHPTATTEPEREAGAKLLCLAPNGRMAVLHSTANLGSKCTSTAKELKESLKAIQANSFELEAAKSKISAVNASLTELNAALSLLCTASSEPGREVCGVFTCSFNPTYEHLCVSQKRACVDVTLEVGVGRPPLGAGWSLLVQHHSVSSQPPEMGASSQAVSSIVVPLTGLASGGSVKTRVAVDVIRGAPLSCSLCCVLRYDASSLLSSLRHFNTDPALNPTTSVATKLCGRYFNALDFLQPPTEQLIDLTHCTGASNTPSTPVSTEPAAPLLHTIELPLSQTKASLLTGVAAREGTPLPPAELCWKLLRGFLPMAVEDALIAVNELASASKVSLATHTGAAITLGAQWLDGSAGEPPQLTVSIQSPCRSTAVEVTQCIEERLRSISLEKHASREQVCKKLAALQCCGEQASALLSELASAAAAGGRQRHSTQLTPDLQDRTFQLYCKLQGIQ